MKERNDRHVTGQSYRSPGVERVWLRPFTFGERQRNREAEHSRSEGALVIAAVAFGKFVEVTLADIPLITFQHTTLYSSHPIIRFAARASMSSPPLSSIAFVCWVIHRSSSPAGFPGARRLVVLVSGVVPEVRPRPSIGISGLDHRRVEIANRVV